MNKTCLNCKHWDRERTDLQATFHISELEPKTWRSCLRTNFMDSISPEDTAYVTDASYYFARLITLPEHGCTMFEDKDES